MPFMRIEKSSEIKPYIRAKNIPNPQLVYGEIKTVLVERCEVKDKDINEEFYEHTKLEGKEKIKATIEGTRKMDRISIIRYKIEIEIDMKPVNKGEIKYIGDIGMKIKGKVQTDHPQNTRFQKSVLGDAFRAFYEKTLYGDQREVYLELATRGVMDLEKELRAFLALLPKMG